MKIDQPKLQYLTYICLYTSNLPESVKFYKDILGLEPSSPKVDVSAVDFYSFKTGTTILALERNGAKKDGMKTREENPFLLQFKLTSLEELESMNIYLEQNDIKLYSRSNQTDWGTITSFCDPDGNKLEIIVQ